MRRPSCSRDVSCTRGTDPAAASPAAEHHLYYRCVPEHPPVVRPPGLAPTRRCYRCCRCSMLMWPSLGSETKAPGLRRMWQAAPTKPLTPPQTCHALRHLHKHWVEVWNSNVRFNPIPVKEADCSTLFLPTNMPCTDTLCHLQKHWVQGWDLSFEDLSQRTGDLFNPD